MWQSSARQQSLASLPQLADEERWLKWLPPGNVISTLSYPWHTCSFQSPWRLLARWVTRHIYYKFFEILGRKLTCPAIAENFNNNLCFSCRAVLQLCLTARQFFCWGPAGLRTIPAFFFCTPNFFYNTTTTNNDNKITKIITKNNIDVHKCCWINLCYKRRCCLNMKNCFCRIIVREIKIILLKFNPLYRHPVEIDYGTKLQSMYANEPSLIRNTI